MALAEIVVILMRYAATKEVNLNTEVQKPSIADVLEFKGATMECAIESTPHEETCIYTSVLEGGNLMQKFKDDELQNMADDGDGQREQGYPIHATGTYATVQTPWPRDRKQGTLQAQQSSKSLCSGFGVLKNPKLPEMSGSGISTLLFLVFRHSCPLILILTKPYRYSSQTALGNVFALPWQRNQTQSVKVRRYCTVADAPADFSQCPMNGDWRHDK